MKNGITCVGMSRVYHMYDPNTFSTVPALFALKRLPLTNNVKETVTSRKNISATTKPAKFKASVFYLSELST